MQKKWKFYVVLEIILPLVASKGSKFQRYKNVKVNNDLVIPQDILSEKPTRETTTTLYVNSLEFKLKP